ncbi:TetR/AcrR family transcriptional regulator [Sphingomonas sp. LB-2]|uniref:TetR/AcrR family transcriptional regulator n=1 Tax=Sphingomonas caeni TaxID=2984949 RepID=UPI002232C32D|nr:TetR/AcrR family transcriptional regulator [Sphingomonas caeni]MCW3847670.1 TetR/AcrR family transcriptional regulator [Sphingomonas caeni]
MEKRAYHHGDLRAALIEAGLKLLAEPGADAPGLREVARAVGVSPTAVYRHFPDKGALLGAMAREGLDRLGSAQAEAGKRGFNAVGRAYITFALQNPALFRLIFANSPNHNPLDWNSDDPDTMPLLRMQAVREVAERDGEGAARLFALRAWALVHGLAVLLLDRQVTVDDATIDAFFEARGPLM